MKRLAPIAAPLVALALAGPAAAGVNSVTVNVDRTSISTVLGHKFFLRSTISNKGDTPASNLVLPASGAPRPPTTGPTVHVSIARRQTLNSGGILPLALGIPSLLGALTLGLRFRRRAS